MNFRTTIVLLVLLAGAAVYLTVSKLWSGKGAETSTQASGAQSAAGGGKLIDADSSDITRVAITPAEGKPIVLSKADGKWRILQPVNAPAEAFQADELVRQLLGIQSRGQLGTDKLASTGFDHPHFVVEMTGKSGKVYRLSVGDKSEIGDTLYVRINDGDKLDIVASSVYDQLDKPAKDYRSKKLVDASQDQIRQLAITRGGKTIRLEKPQNEWQIVEPKKMPADSTAVSDLLFAITGLNAVEFVDKPGALQQYGLNRPLTTVWFSTAPLSTQPATAPTTQIGGTTIEFGAYEDILKRNVYAAVSDGPVATVAKSSMDSFDKAPLDLRDKKVLDIDAAHVESFTLAVDRAATTQPTTQPARQYEYTIVRRREAAVVGPQFGPAVPTQAATQPALAATQPTTQPVAATEPATLPAVAATQPVSKWAFESSNRGEADEGQIDDLLNALHPLRAEKFVDKSPATQPAGTYLLTVRVGPANGHGPQDYTLRFNSPGPTGSATGSYEDLIFELDRSILEKLDGDFKTKKSSTP